MAKKFSPPYWDGTKKFEIELGIHQFSPPYGDGTEMESQVDEAL